MYPHSAYDSSKPSKDPLLSRTLAPLTLFFLFLSWFSLLADLEAPVREQIVLIIEGAEAFECIRLDHGRYVPAM